MFAIHNTTRRTCINIYVLCLFNARTPNGEGQVFGALRKGCFFYLQKRSSLTIYSWCPAVQGRDCFLWCVISTPSRMFQASIFHLSMLKAKNKYKSLHNFVFGKYTICWVWGGLGVVVHIEHAAYLLMMSFGRSVSDLFCWFWNENGIGDESISRNLSLSLSHDKGVLDEFCGFWPCPKKTWHQYVVWINGALLVWLWSVCLMVFDKNMARKVERIYIRYCCELWSEDMICLMESSVDWSTILC